MSDDTAVRVSGPGEPLHPGAATGTVLGPWPRRLLILLALGVLAIVTFFWFRGFAFHTWMGDDLYAWDYFRGDPSFRELFLSDSGSKYRPVATALQWALFQVFPSDFPSWTYFNAGLEFLTACLVFALVLRVARAELYVGFAAALLFVTSRFSYYNVLQAMGTMEALGMLFLVVILHVAVTYAGSDVRWPGFALAGLFLAISLTHERYLALFTFLVLLVVFKGRSSVRARGVLIALLCVPPLLNVVLKKFVFATSVMMGTGGQAVSLDPMAVLRFLVKGGANLLWINWGPDYLSGITMSLTSWPVRVLVGLIVVTIVVCLVAALRRVVRLPDASDRRDEVKYLVLWLVLTASLLLVASITIRQEYRWLYAPWVVTLVYFCYQYARLTWRRVISVTVLALLCVGVLGMDFYYRQHESNVFFFYGQRIADSAREATVGRYGEAMSDKTLYLEKSAEIDWIAGHDLLLSPYLGGDYRKIVWVDSFENSDAATADPEHSVFLRLDWPQRKMVDVTREVLGP